MRSASAPGSRWEYDVIARDTAARGDDLLTMAQLRETLDDAVARLHPQATGDRPRSRVALTCEHASVRIPDAWPAGWPTEDAAVVGTHWSIDLGAEDLTRELAGTPTSQLCRWKQRETFPYIASHACRLPSALAARCSRAERARRHRAVQPPALRLQPAAGRADALPDGRGRQAHCAQPGTPWFAHDSAGEPYYGMLIQGPPGTFMPLAERDFVERDDGGTPAPPDATVRRVPRGGRCHAARVPQRPRVQHPLLHGPVRRPEAPGGDRHPLQR